MPAKLPSRGISATVNGGLTARIEQDWRVR
jgi:hypothetical protein